MQGPLNVTFVSAPFSFISCRTAASSEPGWSQSAWKPSARASERTARVTAGGVMIDKEVDDGLGRREMDLRASTPSMFVSLGLMGVTWPGKWALYHRRTLFPNFAGSLEAPTTAYDDAAKNGTRLMLILSRDGWKVVY